VHANAPLTAEGRRRLVARVLDEGRPLAHVAAESRLARATVRKWVGRFRAEGGAALADRSSRPHRSPTRTDPAVVARIEKLRRDRKLPPRLIVAELAGDGIEVSTATVHRWLRKLGINRLRDLDVTGNSHRVVRRIVTERPGQLVHVDVKKIGAIPDRRRLAGPRPRQHPGPRRPQGAGRLPLLALRRRCPHPARVHRVPGRRTRGHRRRVPAPGHRVLRRPRRHRRTRPDRQRVLLPVRRLRHGPTRRRPTHLHPPPPPPDQWEGRAVQPNPRRRVRLRQTLDLRDPARRLPPTVAHPLQLPPSPHRHRQPAPGHPRPNHCHQRHDAEHLGQHRTGGRVERPQQVHRSLLASTGAPHGLAVDGDDLTHPRHRLRLARQPGSQRSVQRVGVQALQHPADRGLRRRPPAQSRPPRTGRGRGSSRAHSAIAV